MRIELEPQLLENGWRFLAVVGGEENEGDIDAVHRVTRVFDDLRDRLVRSFVIADG